MIKPQVRTTTAIILKLTIILSMDMISQGIILTIKMPTIIIVQILMLLLIIPLIMVLPLELRELQKAEITAILITMIILEPVTIIVKQGATIIIILLDMKLKELQVLMQQHTIIVHMVQMPLQPLAKQLKQLQALMQQDMITVHMVQQLDMELKGLLAQKQQHTTIVLMEQMPLRPVMILVIMILLNMDKNIVMEKILITLNTELL